MQISVMRVGVLLLITAALSAAVTRYYFPQVETKTVEVTKEVVRKDVETVIKTVRSPDGTVETTKTISDHSKITDTDKKVAIVNSTKDWLVSASYSTNPKDFQPIYGVQVNRRILGPAYLGALLNTKGEVGLSIGLEF